jgi:hypothetical protein
MAVMGEVSKEQILDLLYEIADGVDEIAIKLDENLVLLRTINYEAELGMQRIAEARSRYQKAPAP